MHTFPIKYKLQIFACTFAILFSINCVPVLIISYFTPMKICIGIAYGIAYMSDLRRFFYILILVNLVISASSAEGGIFGAGMALIFGIFFAGVVFLAMFIGIDAVLFNIGLGFIVSFFMVLTMLIGQNFAYGSRPSPGWFIRKKVLKKILAKNPRIILKDLFIYFDWSIEAPQDIYLLIKLIVEAMREIGPYFNIQWRRIIENTEIINEQLYYT